jgi:hypothetical protein
MRRLALVTIVLMLTSPSCAGAGLEGDSSANTVADASEDGPDTGGTSGPTDGATPTSNDPSSADDDTNGCVAAAWDDGQWDGACWQ